MSSNVLGKLQKLGKSLMLPIAVMPVVALLLRFGVLLKVPFVSAAGAAVFDNLPILFAIGVAIGFAKNNHGAAALAGAVGYFTMTACATAINEKINMFVLGGMISGILAGNLYNKYHNIKLPDYLGFFGGKRFVPIITSLYSIVLGFIFGYVWPFIQNAIDAVGNWIIGAGEAGLVVFGTLNRLLIPTGLHHIINSITWFVFGEYNGATGDLNRFFAGDPSAGMFMTGFFPVMMFGLPAVALAIYTATKKEQKKAVAGVLISVAFTSFLTGITEPIEFMFMFIAPVLYGIHAVLTGISLAVTYKLGILHGFGFSAGAIDYIVNWNLATKPILIIPIGLAFAALYYIIFVFAIKKFKLNIDIVSDVFEDVTADEAASEKDGIGDLAQKYLEALGGKENIVDLDACITRLRLSLVNTDIVKDKELKVLGASGVIRPSKTTMQVIIGTKAEIVCEEMKKLINNNGVVQK
ncbi:N-acetylglucosamine-specific PTS transporter subunit IIBC [Paramaledivibacter caminithermalis]|uniref:PTS system N-acetylglucosamine-specific IIB component, Glc family (TC 4.A.1.1.7)/PTS system N-acetylglucosamine-specific IIC component, Glc family (TC 4.A.1.1.7) n=1 Tax=Paramaledivibacter caminithermalis (strain DSM 15212 / CIP 107654 / DViRD3) TaxID=1121301 RepID=A0A1M6KIG2_PARC5|nr:N-acetylglucosamine-specific PTS transporter subunit IIBC [Paramaledivibacter caminithermalis]SHJ58736.1 PTS system N-acetylglucosamine-specific IIB component, Glc family (TC 4.A.1.1.7)/PTS system N-acetylglucosamine-specific IIC component, Glc family (TC 4.A.1.1.7) [Paramaledivibacter caminithermalis DSM 15212]